MRERERRHATCFGLRLCGLQLFCWDSRLCFCSCVSQFITPSHGAGPNGVRAGGGTYVAGRGHPSAPSASPARRPTRASARPPASSWAHRSARPSTPECLRDGRSTPSGLRSTGGFHTQDTTSSDTTYLLSTQTQLKTPHQQSPHQKPRPGAREQPTTHTHTHITFITVPGLGSNRCRRDLHT